MSADGGRRPRRCGSGRPSAPLISGSRAPPARRSCAASPTETSISIAAASTRMSPAAGPAARALPQPDRWHRHQARSSAVRRRGRAGGSRALPLDRLQLADDLIARRQPPDPGHGLGAPVQHPSLRTSRPSCASAPLTCSPWQRVPGSPGSRWNCSDARAAVSSGPSRSTSAATATTPASSPGGTRGPDAVPRAGAGHARHRARAQFVITFAQPGGHLHVCA